MLRSHLTISQAGRFVKRCVHTCWTTSGSVRRG